MPAYDHYDPYDPSAQLLSEPFADTPSDQTPRSAHLTPSHVFPPSEIADPEHARAPLPTSDSTNSKEQHPNHQHAERTYKSCASCRAKGKEPFQGPCGEEGRMQL